MNIDIAQKVTVVVKMLADLIPLGFSMETPLPLANSPMGNVFKAGRDCVFAEKENRMLYIGRLEEIFIMFPNLNFNEILMGIQSIKSVLDGTLFSADFMNSPIVVNTGEEEEEEMGFNLFEKNKTSEENEYYSEPEPAIFSL